MQLDRERGSVSAFCVYWGDNMARRGRKSRYESYVKPHLQDIPVWIQTMTEQQIAVKLGIVESTWHVYKNKYPELEQAVISGRQQLVSDVKSALLLRAKGFEYKEKKTYTKVSEKETAVYEETTTKYAPPDVAACNSILQNLDPEWRRDKALYELRKREFELKQRLAEANNWLNDEEE